MQQTIAYQNQNLHISSATRPWYVHPSSIDIYGTTTIKCELDSLHASEAWDEGLEWESYHQFGRTVFSTSAGIEHELE